MKKLRQRMAAWTCRRRRLGAVAASTVSEALADVVGVYSSHPSGPLSLLARCPDMEEEDFRALDRDRLALRIPAVQKSVHMIPTDTVDADGATVGRADGPIGPLGERGKADLRDSPATRWPGARDRRRWYADGPTAAPSTPRIRTAR